MVELGVMALSFNGDGCPNVEFRPKFPELIGLEIASSCNLSCIHCPPHLKEFKDKVRKFGIMDMELFHKLSEEIP